MPEKKFDESTLPPLRDVVEKFKLWPEKKLGQNFLFDLNITDKIVRAGGNLAGIHVIEVGAGPGGLTRSLLQSDALTVSAVEIDDRAIQALENLTRLCPQRLKLIHGDALKLDFSTIAPAPRVIIANLPYNIATPLLIGWLKDIFHDPTAYQHLCLMFQKEVAHRLKASPGNKNYGRLSVITQWLCQIETRFDVPPSAFFPSPKVTSTVVLLTPHQNLQRRITFKTMEQLTAQAFSQRRKMLRSSLKQYRDLFERCDIKETSRAEEVSVAQYLRLAEIVEKEKI